MSDKPVPYTTSSGVQIGKNYNPAKRREFSRDEERIQRMFIRAPLDDGLEDLARMAIICLALAIALIALFTWAAV